MLRDPQPRTHRTCTETLPEHTERSDLINNRVIIVLLHFADVSAQNASTIQRRSEWQMQSGLPSAEGYASKVAYSVMLIMPTHSKRFTNAYICANFVFEKHVFIHSDDYSREILLCSQVGILAIDFSCAFMIPGAEIRTHTPNRIYVRPKERAGVKNTKTQEWDERHVSCSYSACRHSS